MFPLTTLTCCMPHTHTTTSASHLVTSFKIITIKSNLYISIHVLIFFFFMLNKMTSFKQMVLVLMLIELYTSYGALALSMDYYRMSCPFAEMIVRMTVNQALRRDQTLAGPLLRLHFHDCFVQVYIIS